ncbi:MAG: hypothetical protein HF973_16825 [Chloroflexi bacterium]|nr:hypothetical protein [Chloroflexota bacterium]
MIQMTFEDEKFKFLMKEALLELIQEREDIFYDLFSEVLEDYALAKAIDEGMSSETVSREEVFAVLETDG